MTSSSALSCIMWLSVTEEWTAVPCLRLIVAVGFAVLAALIAAAGTAAVPTARKLYQPWLLNASVHPKG